MYKIYLPPGRPPGPNPPPGNELPEDPTVVIIDETVKLVICVLPPYTEYVPPFLISGELIIIDWQFFLTVTVTSATPSLSQSDTVEPADIVD